MCVHHIEEEQIKLEIKSILKTKHTKEHSLYNTYDKYPICHCFSNYLYFKSQSS